MIRLFVTLQATVPSGVATTTVPSKRSSVDEGA